MKSIIFTLLLITNAGVWLYAQSAEPCDKAEYFVKGVFANSSAKAPILAEVETNYIQIGDKGELSKYFEENIFGMSTSGWMEIGTVQVTAKSANSITFKVIEKKSVVTINGEEKSHFVAGKIVKFTKYAYKEPTLKTFYWDDGKTIKAEGTTICENRIGEWKFYYANGQLDQVGSFNEEGKSFGIWKFYTEEGKLSRQGNVIHDKADGLWSYYDVNGKLSFTKTFEKNIITGPFKYYYPNGNIQSEGELVADKEEGVWKYYYENGNLKSSGNYTHEVKTGLWKYYEEDGTISYQNEFDEKGEINGMFKKYYPNGNIKREGYLKFNKEDGVWNTYYEDGQLKSTVHLTSDVLSGPYKIWYQNGQLQEEGNYNGVGELDGTISIYYENGKPKAKGNYSKGIRTGKWFEWDEKGKKKSIKY